MALISETPLYLLKPAIVPPRLESLTVLEDASDIEWIFSAAPQGDILAVDIETEGSDASLPFSRIVGFGFADSRGSIYIPTPSFADVTAVLQLIHKYKPRLIAHNVAFDSTYLYRDNQAIGLAWPSFYACTFAMYKMLATEGWLGQTWGLKDAQTQLLGWTETNERELDEWLVSNGYANQQGKPSKADMWRAPSEILGKYCALDADSTYLLWKHVLEPVASRFPALLEYHTKHLMLLQKNIAQQQLSGLPIDKAKLEEYGKRLDIRLASIKQAFLVHPTVKEHIDFYNRQVVEERLSKEPPKYKKCKPRPPEPPTHTKEGKPSKAHQLWVENASKHIPEISKGWLRWKELLEEESSTNHFNLNSGPQRSWLFYERCKYPVLVWTDNEENPKPAVDEDAMKGFGEAGRLLIEWQALTKERTFVTAYLEAYRESSGTVHFRMKIPGTLTGRLSGGS